MAADKATLRERPWSELQPELLDSIGKCFDCGIDVLRFRSVCTAWRSALSPSKSLPFPIVLFPNFQLSSCTLSHSTVYLLEPNPATAASSSSSSCSGYLLKVNEFEQGKVRLLNPLSDRQIWLPPHEVLSLLDFRVIQLGKSYTLEGTLDFLVKKAVLFPNSPWTRVDDFVVLAIGGGKLAYYKLGDEKWTLVGEGAYCDILVYEDRFHVVDIYGVVYKIDSEFNVTAISPQICGGGCWKRLVESEGDLYVVDRFMFPHGRDAHPNPNKDHRDFLSLTGRASGRVGDFKVYKFDPKESKWIEVKSLDDRVFFLGYVCSFSVDSRLLVGFRGNCIYFAARNVFFSDQSDVFSGTAVFDLKDGSIWEVATSWFPPTF